MKTFSTLAILLTFVGFSQVARAADCSAAHCSHLSEVAIEACKFNAEMTGKTVSEYAAAGGKAVLQENGAFCSCGCSCVVATTQVSTPQGYKPVEALVRGELVITPIAKAEVSSVDFKLGDRARGEEVVNLTFSNGASITSSGNHTYITPDERITTARELKTGQTIKAVNGTTVQVVGIQELGPYNGSLHNLAVNKTSESARDHVIDTEGVLSGDWLLQSTNDLVEEELFLRTAIIKQFN